MPCIFLKAGMTKRLQVTTADTGFPGTKRWTQWGIGWEGGGVSGRRGRVCEGEIKKEKTMSNISAETLA